MGAPPNWLTYIGTPDVDATVRQAEELGAMVLKGPDDIPNGGRFAVLRDPQGAVFAIYRSPASAVGPAGDKPAMGDFSWHELMTTDPEAAFDFYQRLFGWDKTDAMDMGPDLGTYQMFSGGGASMGGIYRKPAAAPAPPHWLPYAYVPDSKKAAALATARGAKILNGPMQVPGGDWIVMAVDPQGAVFAVHSPGAAAAKPAKSAAKAKPAKRAKKKPARKAAKKSARKPAKKSARKPAKKSAKKAARKSAKKAGKKGAKKPAKRAASKPRRRPGKKGRARTPARRPAPKRKGKVARRKRR